MNLVLFVFLVGVCSFRATKSDASISTAILRPRESGCSWENHRELCALTSPNINASVFFIRCWIDAVYPGLQLECGGI